MKEKMKDVLIEVWAVALFATSTFILVKYVPVLMNHQYVNTADLFTTAWAVVFAAIVMGVEVIAFIAAKLA